MLQFKKTDENLACHRNIATSFASLGTDVQGTLKTSYAVAQIKGVSLSLANAVLKKAGVNPDLRVGYLTESTLQK